MCPLAHDPVHRPAHYTFGSVQVIDLIEGVDAPYHLGNVIKYVARAGKKGDNFIEDYEKARWYLRRFIERGVFTERLRTLSAAMVQHIVTQDWKMPPDATAILLTVALDANNGMRLRHALDRLDTLLDNCDAR